MKGRGKRAFVALSLVAGMIATVGGVAGAASSGTTASSFTSNFAALAALKSVAAAGSGGIGVILPDTTSSTRYTEFDAPLLTKSFEAAGLSSSQYSIQNGDGSDSTFITDAEADLSSGDKVLVIDPEDSATGIAVEAKAKAAGAKVIDYDRLTLGGTRSYYVSFNNVAVGTLIGKGFVSCVVSEKVKHPNVIVMKGSPTDNNATLFAEGYDAVLAKYFAKKTYSKLASPAGTWTPSVALTEFQQALTAHKTINSLVSPNDENAAPIISYLKRLGVKPHTFPVTGQDATLVGIDNILQGYQCGTVYKPIFEEAQAAAALALYLRAGQTPPAGLVNGETTDSTSNTTVPSVLLTPEWVTAATIAKTVVADGAIKASQICVSGYAKLCKTYGIK